MQGRGKFLYGSGEIYEGEFKHNSPNGNGVFKAHFCKYTGNFVEGKMEGNVKNFLGNFLTFLG
jgi:hypothetical protein